MNILINAANLSGAGAQSVAISLLPELTALLPECNFTITLPDMPIYRELVLSNNCNCHFLGLRTGISNDLSRIKSLLYDVSRLASESSADVCLTLGDIAPVGLSCPSILLLHQPLLVYGKTDLGKIKSWPLVKRMYLYAHFLLTRHTVNTFIVQTPVMAERLSYKFNIEKSKICILPQPVPKHIHSSDMANDNAMISQCKKKCKLLFLAGNYKHKNHKILASVAKEIRLRKLHNSVHIFTTIDWALSDSYELINIIDNNYDIITNLGRLKGNEVAGALNASSALFLPTLVESYGLIYLEALELGKPILTSDRDFAHWICGDLAMYFDPFSSESIVDAIEKFITTVPDDSFSIRIRKHLATFPANWREVAVNFADILFAARKHIGEDTLD